MRRESIAILLILVSIIILIAVLALWARGFTVKEITLIKGGIVVNETRGYEVYFNRARGIEYKILLLEAKGNLDIRIAVIFIFNEKTEEILSDRVIAGSSGYIKLPKGALIDIIHLKSLNPPTYIPPNLIESVEPGILRIEYKMPAIGANALIEVRLRIEWFNITIVRESDFTIKVEFYNGWNHVGVLEEHCSGKCILEKNLEEFITSMDVIAIERDRRAQVILILLSLTSTLTLLSSTTYIITKYKGGKRKLFKI